MKKIDFIFEIPNIIYTFRTDFLIYGANSQKGHQIR